MYRAEIIINELPERCSCCNFSNITGAMMGKGLRCRILLKEVEMMERDKDCPFKEYEILPMLKTTYYDVQCPYVPTEIINHIGLHEYLMCFNSFEGDSLAVVKAELKNRKLKLTDDMKIWCKFYGDYYEVGYIVKRER